MTRTAKQLPGRPLRPRQRRHSATVICLIACALGLAIAPSRLFAQAPAATTGQVLVTGLPAAHEIVGVSAGGGYHFNVGPAGEITKFTDSAGNMSIDLTWNINGNQPGLVVADDRGTVLAPAGAAPKIETVSEREVHVTVAYASGVSVVYVAQPDRLGFQVSGPAAAYKLTFHMSARMDGGWVMAGTTPHFLSAEEGAFAGPRQTLVDMRRSRALAVDAPSGSVNWDVARLDAWGSDEYLSVSTTVKPGQTAWVSPAAIPAYSGPVSFGLYGQYALRGNGPLLSVGTLSSRSLSAPVKLHLSVAPAKFGAGDSVFAALLPTAPVDPVEADNIGWEWLRKPDYTDKFIPVALTGSGQDWQIAADPGLAPGVYRLRVWIAPMDAKRPEALGGMPHAIAPLYPDFNTADVNFGQTSPQGDTFVLVSPVTAGSLALRCPSQRSSFWRGEAVPVLVQARRSDGGVALVHVKVTAESGGQTVAADGLRVATVNGYGTGEFRLATASLAPGDYTAHATAEGCGAADFRFHVSGPIVGGMADIVSPFSGPVNIDGYGRIGGSVWCDVMPGSYGPAWPGASPTDSALRTVTSSLPLTVKIPTGSFDDLVRDNWMSLQGIQSRQISFGLHHSITEQVEETHRKDVVYAELGRRFPSTLGLILDYDLVSSTGAYDYGSPSYHQGILDRQKLLEQRWQAAWAQAQKNGATAADQPRIHALFNAGIVAEMYRGAVSEVHAAVPQQRLSSSITADHTTIDGGQYAPVEYGPLDFRYMEVWNDQIYPDSAHDMQESYWTELLRQEKPAGQPVWLTIPTAAQPGTHFRRSLDAIGRGATGIGYGAEGSAGLTGGWGASLSVLNARYAQEAASGDMARRYGSWLNQFEPAPRVAILDSVSQGGYNFGISNPRFFAYYICAQINRPAKLITEDEIGRGEFGRLKDILVIGQTAKLPDATMRNLAAFIAHGGRVLCDGDTSLAIDGSVRLPNLKFPSSLWPHGSNHYHVILKDMVANQGAILRAALGDTVSPSLFSPDGAAMVAEKSAANGSLVIVTNNHDYPIEKLFTEEQRVAAFFRNFIEIGEPFYKDLRAPSMVTLSLRSDVAAKPLHVYDVFGARELPIDRSQNPPVVHVDLAGLQGRALLLTSAPLPSPQLMAKPRTGADPTVTVCATSPVPIPVRIRVDGQTIYRAATPTGQPETFAIGPSPGTAQVELTSLITGESWQSTVRLTKPAVSSLKIMPPAQVIDPVRVRAVLNQPGAALYVDSRQADMLPIAKTVSQKLGLEVVFNPDIHSYPINYAPSTAEAAIHDDILTHHLIGLRSPTESYLQWTGALQPSVVWNRPAVLFGLASDNRLIDDLNAVTMLSRPATAAMVGPGAAIIEAVSSPFWNSSDAIICLCSDRAGMLAACEALEAIKAGRSVPGALPQDDDGGSRAARRSALGFDPPIRPDGMRPMALTAVHAQPVTIGPVLPVAALSAVGGDVLATLQSPGRNIALIGEDGKIRWQAATGAFQQPVQSYASADGNCVSWDGYFTWRHDPTGKLLWKGAGRPLRAPEADGSLWLSTGSSVRHVAADGATIVDRPVTGTFMSLSPSGDVLLQQKPGAGSTVKMDSSLVAIDPATGKELWSDPKFQVVQTHLTQSPDTSLDESSFSADGSRVALLQGDNRAGRDDIDLGTPNFIVVLDSHTGKSIQRLQMGEPMSYLQMTPDGRRVIAFGLGFSNAMFIVDVDSGVARRLQLPEKGSYARALSADQHTMWIAGENLYKVNLDSLDVVRAAPMQFMALAPRQDGGIYGGTLDGSVVQLDGTGHTVHGVSLADGIASGDIDETMTGLRNALMLDDASYEPHTVPSKFGLPNEYPGRYYNYENGMLAVRGDNVLPLQVAVKITDKGTYRFKIDLGNPKTNKIGMLSLIFNNGGSTVTMKPTDGDKWRQYADVDLAPGTYLITVVTANMIEWTGMVNYNTMEIVKVGK